MNQCLQNGSKLDSDPETDYRNQNGTEHKKNASKIKFYAFLHHVKKVEICYVNHLDNIYSFKRYAKASQCPSSFALSRTSIIITICSLTKVKSHREKCKIMTVSFQRLKLSEYVTPPNITLIYQATFIAPLPNNSPPPQWGRMAIMGHFKDFSELEG